MISRSEAGSTSTMHEDFIPCMHCNYNLCGHKDDVCQCPECGNSNDLKQWRFYNEYILAESRRLEFMPTLAVGLFMAMLGCIASSLVLERWRLALILILIVPAWIAAVGRFSVLTHRCRGWIKVLACYHAAGGWYTVIMIALGWISAVSYNYLSDLSRLVILGMVLVAGFSGVLKPLSSILTTPYIATKRHLDQLCRIIICSKGLPVRPGGPDSASPDSGP